MREIELKTRLLGIGSGLIACQLLGGCAYFTNYTRPIDLRDGSVAIDVKQRVVFSQGRSEFDKVGQRVRSNVVVCAEPSPDALTVLGASGGLSINNGAAKVGNASLAFAESGASIGLRTQSIQLLRDAMYRLCEGYAAGAVSDSDFAAMQRRYQSTMMGLIAIEQLTGPIVAAQTMLTSSSVAQAGASAGDAAVDSAQSKLDAASEASLRAQTELETSQSTLDATRAEIKLTNQKRTEEKSKKEPDGALVDSLNERLVSLAGQEKTQQNDVADKKRRLDEAQLKREEMKAALASAKAKVSSSAGGAGRLGDIAGATAASNVAFATAVREIVSEINLSYSRDGCLTLLTELARTGALGRSTTASGEETAKLQRRIVELRAERARLDELGEQEAKVANPVNASKMSELRGKYEQTVSELNFAEENLGRAKRVAEAEANMIRSVDRTTDQAVEVCQRILAIEDRPKSEK